jgi:hypothetical protein
MSEPRPKVQETPPARRIYWSVVAAAVVPCTLFVGVTVAMVACWPKAQPARAHTTATPGAPALASAAETAAPAEEEVNEIRLPGHAPVAVKLSDLPLIVADDLPADPLAPLPQQPARPAAVDADQDPRKVEGACQRFDTAVNFVDSPVEAFKQATKDNKLTFVIHVSGNFEDSKFT